MPIQKFRPTYTFDEDRLNALKAIVPEAFADGAINWDTLHDLLADHLEDESPDAEHFGLTWPGKRKARRLAGQPSNGTLVPAPGEGVNEADTRNLFIEGDNLEVLKLLQKSYAGRVKLIYIDPPYNTGKDFVYPDDYSEPLESYLRRTGQTGEKGELLASNPKSDGRFHSNWLNMMYPRLRLARNLLRDDGVIFVSIDDREVQNLRALLNEIFGEENYFATFIWLNEGNIDNQSKVKRNHEYIIGYAKDESLILAPDVIDPNIPTNSKLYNPYIENTIVKNGPKNPISSVVLPTGFPASFESGVIEPKQDFWPQINQRVIVENHKIQNSVTVTSGWSSKQIFENFIQNSFKPVLDTKGQETTFFISDTGAIINRKKRLEKQSHVLTVLKGMGTVQGESAKLAELGIKFSYPKPVDLLKYILRVGANEDDITMDFFSGSCPVAEATFTLNREDGGNRRFIMVQLPEPTGNPDFPTIAEIGKERIRRVIANMQAEDAGKLNLATRDTPEDLGFKVFKLARSNFKQWDGDTAGDVDALQTRLDDFVTPLVDDWREEDLLTEIILQQGFPLDSAVAPLEGFTHNRVVSVTTDFLAYRLIVCLDRDIHADTIAALHLNAEDVFVCLDSALSDEAKARLSDTCNLNVI